MTQIVTRHSKVNTVASISAMRQKISNTDAFDTFCREFAGQLLVVREYTPAQYFVAYCLQVHISKVTFTPMANNGQRIDCPTRKYVNGWAMPLYLRTHA